jgi:hypothetical protein
VEVVLLVLGEGDFKETPLCLTVWNGRGRKAVVTSVVSAINSISALSRQMAERSNIMVLVMVNREKVSYCGILILMALAMRQTYA